MRYRLPFLGCKLLAILCSLITPLAADQFGDFTYIDNGTSITITGYPTTAVGAVIIPASIVGKPVTSIGESAFFLCSDLTSVTIPSSVTSIGSNAFRFCNGLTSVTIPSSVISIGSEAFYSCRGLTSVTIPSSVTSIGNGAFTECSGLTSVTIPSSVTTIGSAAFFGCSGLSAITVDPLNSVYSSNAGVLLNKVQSILIQHPSGKTGTYAIPSSVTSISSDAFSGCGGLTSVAIPSSVTSIGSGAFSFCSGLTSVTLPSSVTTIGEYAFYRCSSLTSTTFLGTAPTMGVSVFDDTADGFTIYYFGSTSGFSSPSWLGYSTVELPAPDITVEIPSAPALVDGLSMVDFQSTTAGSAIIKTFTIRNDGNLPLTGLALSTVGPNADNFALGTLGATSLAAGVSTSFDVTCTPQAGAAQTATLRIASNDSNENPFDIPLNAKFVTINGDDFNDNFKNTAKWGADTISSPDNTLSEINSRLEYISTNAAGYYDTYRPWILNQATYDEDWELIMDVGNSLSWTSGEQDTGIGIDIFPPSTNTIGFFTEMNSSFWEGFGGFHGFVSGQTEDESGNLDQRVSSAGANGSIRIVYDSITKVITTYCDTDGSANGYSWAPLASFGITGSGGETNANWNMSGSQVFQIVVYGFNDGSSVSSGQMTADNFTIITQAAGAPVTPIQSWQIAKFGSASNPDAAFAFDKDKDGLPNLIEYAFKLEPQVPGTPILTTLTGTSGLPRITPIGSGTTQRLRLEYVRLKASSNPGITYVPQFSSNLLGSGPSGWSNASGPEIKEDIDTQWERVVVEDTPGTGLPNRFGRVVVTAP